jgi:hypothetical protein
MFLRKEQKTLGVCVERTERAVTVSGVLAESRHAEPVEIWKRAWTTFPIPLPSGPITVLSELAGVYSTEFAARSAEEVKVQI